VGDRDAPAGTRRSPGGSSAAEPVTVEQLLARQGGPVGRRRAARRDQSAPEAERGVAIRGGLPPVPGATVRVPDAPPVRRSGPIPPLPHLASARRPDAPDRRPPRSPRPPAAPGRRRLLRVGTALALILGVVVLYHLALYFYIDQKIGRVQALATDGAEILAPQLQADTQNYLVVGTGVPARTGPSSVTAEIVSVSAAGNRAVLVSVPPTAMVDTPLCRTARGVLRDPVTEEFASSLLNGGPACMVRAVQQLSGLRVDHFLGVDLAKLPGMVDALGGVPICTVPSASTSAAALPPPPGASTLTGRTAAGFLRPGTGDPDPTGAAVTERSQRLLTATLRSALTVGSLADPVRLARFLSRAADALTVDDQTTLGDLRVLAGSLGSLPANAVQRAGLPVAKVDYVPAGSSGRYAILDGAATRALFDSVIGSTRLPPEALRSQDAAPPGPPAAGSTAPTAAPPAPVVAPPRILPGAVTVDVLNGTGRAGLAGKVADALRGQGFRVGTVGNSSGTVGSSTVRFGPGAADKARVLAAAVPGAVLQASSSIGNTVQLVIGPNYSTVVPVPPPAAAPTTAAPSTPVAAQAPAPSAAPVTC
jgi:LCP family protein required for cell wall assembly